jgi:hypothetical protein
MNKKTGSLISRRQFARRAAVVSAAATLTPAETIFSSTPYPAAPQSSQNAPAQLSPQAQVEADSRYQQILSLYGDRLDDSQKANIKKMCSELQATVERIRKFNLQNGNTPALYLKPLVERQKKTSPVIPPKQPS